MSDGSAQAEGISQLSRIIHSVCVEIYAMNTSHRIPLQEPLRRRIVVPCLIVIQARFLIELTACIRTRLGHRA